MTNSKPCEFSCWPDDYGKRISPDTTVDHTAMLLSTDWFLPYWHAIGIHMGEAGKKCYQYGCRDIVRQIVNDEESYYLASFSEARIEQARNDLRRLARSCNLNEPSATRIANLAADKTHRDQLEKTAWLFRSLGDELALDDELDERTKAALEHSRMRFLPANELQSEEICLGSATAWGAYVRSLTPELPAIGRA